MKKYGLIADLHLHAWNVFSTVSPSGINSRLQILFDEVRRCADEVIAAGGNTICLAGDIFHVRGSLAPSVLNPTMDFFDHLIKDGLDVIIIPGNHDLEGKTSTRVSSAVTSLEKVGCKVAENPQYYADLNTLVFPWVEHINDLKSQLEDYELPAGAVREETDLILHAPIDDVIPGLPAHGLTSEWLAKLGFKRVFSGHYHNHKDFGNGVYSIGAIAHHTWSDPGTKAGFLLVTDDEVKFNKSHAPEFIDIDASMDEMEVSLAVDRNYVRAKINKSKTEDVEKLREFLIKSGAKGVVINAIREPVRTRAVASLKAGSSVETSLGEYITKSDAIEADIKAEVTARAVAILGETA